MGYAGLSDEALANMNLPFVSNFDIDQYQMKL